MIGTYRTLCTERSSRGRKTTLLCWTRGRYTQHINTTHTQVDPGPDAPRLAAEGAWDAPTLHALQREQPIPRGWVGAGALRVVMVARQQLAVEAADRSESGRGLYWDKEPASLQVGVPRGVLVLVLILLCWVLLDEVEAVPRKAKALGRPPLTRH
eukprot:scaffold89081_cov69-Phaeocystis_antarctica.AAC.3